MPVGNYDPDEDEQTNAKAAKKAREGKTELQRKALKACGRKYFKTVVEHRRFKTIEVLAIGSTEESMLQQEWMKHCIEIWEVANARRTVRVMRTLMAYMENTEYSTDWKATFGRKALEKRKQAIISDVKDNPIYQ